MRRLVLALATSATLALPQSTLAAPVVGPELPGAGGGSGVTGLIEAGLAETPALHCLPVVRVDLIGSAARVAASSWCEGSGTGFSVPVTRARLYVAGTKVQDVTCHSTPVCTTPLHTLVSPVEILTVRGLSTHTYAATDPLRWVDWDQASCTGDFGSVICAQAACWGDSATADSDCLSRYATPTQNTCAMESRTAEGPAKAWYASTSAVCRPGSGGGASVSSISQWLEASPTGYGSWQTRSCFAPMCAADTCQGPVPACLTTFRPCHPDSTIDSSATPWVRVRSRTSISTASSPATFYHASPPFLISC